MDNFEVSVLMSLPHEILCEITSYLTPRELGVLSRCERGLYYLLKVGISPRIDILAEHALFLGYLEYLRIRDMSSRLKSISFISQGMIPTQFRSRCYSSFTSLKNLTSLENVSLRLGSALTDPQTIISICELLPPSLTCLKMVGMGPSENMNDVKTDSKDKLAGKCWSVLQTLPSLTSLSLVDVGKLGASTIRSLSHLHLNELTLGWSSDSFGDKIYRRLYLMPLCGIETLTSLRLLNCHLTGDVRGRAGAVFQSISKLQELKKLELNICTGIVEAEYPWIPKMEKLGDFTWITSEDINLNPLYEHLAPLTSLTSLHLEHSRFRGGTLLNCNLSQLKKLKKLERLTLPYNGIHGIDLTLILSDEGLPLLKKLVVGDYRMTLEKEMLVNFLKYNRVKFRQRGNVLTLDVIEEHAKHFSIHRAELEAEERVK